MFSEKDSENLDDLIGSSQQPIIVKDSGSDKKFLYTLLILLVILFMIALGLIAFLGGKYFGDSSNSREAKVEQTVETQSAKVAQVEQKVAKPVATKESSNGSISELESIVQTEEKPKPKTTIEKTISKVAPAKKGGLSREEMAMIAQLVAKELQKSKAASSSANAKSSTNSVASGSSNKKDAALMASLESAQTDTLQDEKIDTKAVKGDVKANSGKKIDTFNKVIVSNKPAQNDELAQLSAEIDTILGSEDVKKAEQNLKYKKDFDRENAQRAKELRFIVVKRGDTLSSIAYRAYGRASAYTKIYNANPDLVKNPNRIYVGMRLRVPVDGEYKAAQAGN